MLVKGATDISWFEWNTHAGLISGFIFVYSNVFFYMVYLIKLVKDGCGQKSSTF